jgi:hypothetical protein
MDMLLFQDKVCTTDDDSIEPKCVWSIKATVWKSGWIIRFVRFATQHERS